MNNKKSMKRISRISSISRISKKRKYNKKIKNTRKNYKKKGGNKFDKLKKVIKSTAHATAAAYATNIKKTNSHVPAANSVKNALNSDIANKIKKEINNYVGEHVFKSFVEQNYNGDKNNKPKVDIDVHAQLKKIAEKEEKIKFSELASEGWFSSVNVLTSKIKKSQKNAQALLQLDELVKNYETEEDDNEKEKIERAIALKIYFMTDEDATKYDIDKEKKGRYIPDTSKIKENVKTLKQKSTFTYNLLNNIDISPKEIQTAYCKKWTKDICQEDDTPVILMKRMLYYCVFATTNVVGEVKQEPKPFYQKFVDILPYTYVPGYNISINGVATVKTVYGALFGFGEKWLDNILGILDPIIDTVFDEIKNSDLDFTTLLLSSMSGKTEKEIDDFFVKHQNIKILKDELNEFLKKNAHSFSQEYKTTHYIGFSEEFQKNIKNAATEEMKAKIETEYHNIEERVAKKILTIATGLTQFREKLLLFINADDFGNFDNLLETNEKSIDVLEKDARSKLKIQ